MLYVVSAADGRVFALKQVKLKGMKRADREEAIDEVCCLPLFVLYTIWHLPVCNSHVTTRPVSM